ncbi:hypothetical protein EJ08DRAFT_737193 [Tothia fuscella]|uniref:DASH complex subunit DUO1 n=1 Tax=Tothia fuscella TaxID=1048955 RepID=A0A9P4TV66_9PEZI|nr:hypothetical protein EJ08DRAFT_737193 [Tothia fuscella]
MAETYDDPDLEKYNLSDSDDHLFDTPAQHKGKNTVNMPANGKPTDPTQQSKSRPEESRYDAEEAEKLRDVALRQELANVRKINEVIEGVVESLEKAKSNMDTVSRTVTSASTLLQTWTRILSQTEHNQRLILNPAWQGATQDLADIEAEESNRQRDAQRREAEERHRREAAARRAEEEERRKAAAAASRGTKGARGRVRGSTRGGASSGYVGIGGQSGRGGSTSRYTTSGTTRTRTGTGIGRGVRGSGRGLG